MKRFYAFGLLLLAACAHLSAQASITLYNRIRTGLVDYRTGLKDNGVDDSIEFLNLTAAGSSSYTMKFSFVSGNLSTSLSFGDPNSDTTKDWWSTGIYTLGYLFTLPYGRLNLQVGKNNDKFGAESEVGSFAIVSKKAYGYTTSKLLTGASGIGSFVGTDQKLGISSLVPCEKMSDSKYRKPGRAMDYLTYDITCTTALNTLATYTLSSPLPGTLTLRACAKTAQNDYAGGMNTADWTDAFGYAAQLVYAQKELFLLDIVFNQYEKDEWAGAVFFCPRFIPNTKLVLGMTYAKDGMNKTGFTYTDEDGLFYTISESYVNRYYAFDFRANYAFTKRLSLALISNLTRYQIGLTKDASGTYLVRKEPGTIFDAALEASYSVKKFVNSVYFIGSYSTPSIESEDIKKGAAVAAAQIAADIIPVKGVTITTGVSAAVAGVGAGSVDGSDYSSLRTLRIFVPFNVVIKM